MSLSLHAATSSSSSASLVPTNVRYLTGLVASHQTRRRRRRQTLAIPHRPIADPRHLPVSWFRDLSPTDNMPPASTSACSTPSAPDPVLLPSPPAPETVTALLELIANAFTTANDPLELYFLRTETRSGSGSGSDSIPPTLTLPIVLGFITPNVSRALTTERCEAWIVPSSSSSSESQPPPPPPSTTQPAAQQPLSSIEATLLLYAPSNPRPARPVVAGTPAAIVVYGTQSEAIKQRTLAAYKRSGGGGGGWYYVYIVARNPEVARAAKRPRGRGGGGAVTKLMRDVVLARAEKERVPVYLEATSQHSRSVYEWFGFEVVGEIVLPPIGVGKDEGSEGQGVTIWCMLWTPESLKTSIVID